MIKWQDTLYGHLYLAPPFQDTDLSLWFFHRTLAMPAGGNYIQMPVRIHKYTTIFVKKVK